MAKAILSLFGGISAFFGVMVIGAAFVLRYRGWDLGVALEHFRFNLVRILQRRRS